MVTIENLLFTKFFDVKSPIGLEQREENLGNYSIGMDMYMPKCTPAFREAVVKANEKLYPGFYITEYLVGDDLHWKFLDDNDNCIMMVKDNHRAEYTIYKPIQIPTGIGVMIPANCWAEMCTKSSNFTLGYGQNEGKIDMNYTYGMSVQLFPINNMVINLESEQKFAQLIFHEAVPIIKTSELNREEWDNHPVIADRRKKRTGGFGHTGKFD